MRIKQFFICIPWVALIVITLSFTANANSIGHAVGVGAGLPYGSLGINYELSLNDFFAPTAGIGYRKENVMWNAGFRMYYPGRESKLRGRITALYGTNTILEITSPTGTEYETRKGVSGGVGFSWFTTKNMTVEGDLFFADADTPEGTEKKSSDILISIGFSYRW